MRIIGKGVLNDKELSKCLVHPCLEFCVSLWLNSLKKKKYNEECTEKETGNPRGTHWSLFEERVNKIN